MKKHLLKCLSGVCLAIGFSMPHLAQGQYEPQKMNFRPVSKWKIPAEAKALAGNRPHTGIFRFRHPLSDQTREQLRQLGIRQGKMLSSRLCILSVPSHISVKQLKSADAMEFAEIKPVNRCDKDLYAKLNYSNEADELEIQLLPHPSLSPGEIRQAWKPEWGSLLQIWPGKNQKWTIRANVLQIKSLLEENWVFHAEESQGRDVPYSNQISAAEARVSFVQAGPSGLSGDGISVGIGDGGRVETHADLESRLQNLDSAKIPSFADHQDHVSGTIGSPGLLQADQKGMAPKARLFNLSTNSVLSMTSLLKDQYGIRLTNNSYGAALICSRAGVYNATSAFLDNQSVENPDVLHVFAAGNQGSVTCESYPAGYFNLAEGYPVAKNCLTVGAVDGWDGATWFSSKGPTRDGRVKPEIVAMGNDLISTTPFDGYGVKSGTSMAAPGVTGALALLAEHYKNLHNQTYPESALLKALLCNSADDLGNPGVDFAFGYGRLNIRKAKAILDQNQIKFQTITSQGTHNLSLTAPAQATGLRVMLSWTDPAGLPGGSANLVHDLDLRVTKNNGQIFLPWVLNSSPSAIAQNAQRAEDHTNNLEQVSLPVTGGEAVSVRINCGELAEQNQKYWIVYEWIVPELVLTFPVSGAYLASGQGYTFRWDLQGQETTGLVLESSSDSLSGWATFQSLGAGSNGFAAVTLSSPGLEKRFFRLKANLQQGGTFISNTAGVWISPKINLQTEICQNHVRLSWPVAPAAEAYEILQLDIEAGRWNPIGRTTSSSRIVSQLENGRRYAFAVKPWFSNNPGMISDGKMVTPGGSGSCPWASDLGIIRLNSPKNARQFSREMNTQNPPSLVLKNVGNTAFQNKPVSFFIQLNNGTIKQTNRSISLSPGDSSVIILSNLFVPANPGQYSVRVWFALGEDANKSNDTLVRTFRQVANPAVALPVTLNFENIAEQSYKLSQFSHPVIPELDFNSLNGGRMATRFSAMPAAFGSRCLKLDKEKIDGKTGNSEVIFTFNLSQYNASDQLALDFDLFSFGEIPQGSHLSIRASDEQAWTEWIPLWQSDIVAGTVKKFRGLDLSAALNSHLPGKTFQLRFSYTGKMPSDVPNGLGYAIDNLSISRPPKEVVIKKLIAPIAGCTSPNEIRKVKLRLWNPSDSAFQQIRAGYSLSSSVTDEEIIPLLNAGDSLDFEFTHPLPVGLFGNQEFKFWVRSQNDVYPVNDTLRNIRLFFSPVVQSFPYYEPFEQGNGFWHSYGQNDAWEWGKPQANLEVIDTSANGLRIWGTNISGNYPANSRAYLESPCFNLSGSDGVFRFSFNGNFKTENDYDYLWLEISEDGKTWNKAGQTGQGTHWYNHGSDQWTGTSGGWTVHSIGINAGQLADKTRVRFRFGFSSDISNQAEGAGLDDIHIEASQVICSDSSFFSPVPLTEANNWLLFGNQNGVVAEVEDIPGLGAVELKMKNAAGGIRYHNNIPYLSRNFLISPENQTLTQAKVRLYLKVAELEALQAADSSIRSFQDLGIYQYAGTGADLSLDNNPSAGGQSNFILPRDVLKVPTADGYFLEFSVSFFSEFYISSRKPGTQDSLTLPVHLVFFGAQQENEKAPVTLEWETTSEILANRFDLAFSCDRKNFTVFHTEAAKGHSQGGKLYSVLHTPPACNGDNLIYRLRQFDIGSSEPSFQTFAQIRNGNRVNPLVIAENPAVSELKLLGMNAQSQVSVYNAEGKKVASWDWEGTETRKDIGFLPPGLYFITIENPNQRARLKLIKQ